MITLSHIFLGFGLRNDYALITDRRNGHTSTKYSNTFFCKCVAELLDDQATRDLALEHERYFAQYGSKEFEPEYLIVIGNILSNNYTVNRDCYDHERSRPPLVTEEDFRCSTLCNHFLFFKELRDPMDSTLDVYFYLEQTLKRVETFEEQIDRNNRRTLEEA